MDMADVKKERTGILVTGNLIVQTPSAKGFEELKQDLIARIKKEGQRVWIDL